LLFRLAAGSLSLALYRGYRAFAALLALLLMYPDA